MTMSNLRSSPTVRALDLKLSDDSTNAKRFLSYFRQKNLRRFDRTRVGALYCGHVGDFLAVENINYSIEVLGYLQDHPLVVLDLK